MPYIELYDDDIIDIISLGQYASDFNELRGDYIKLQVLPADSDAVLDTFYSNRILFKYPTVDEYYFGDYHYHSDQPDMGFCTEGVHTDESITNLKPLLYGGSINEPLNSETKYKKHFDIFKDGKNRIYLKPNEIIKFLKLGEAKYRIRIFFLRSIKSMLGGFLKTTTNNLIENGNFLAALEATQTGDIDRSVGRNNFNIINNPGIGQFVLEQDGIEDNIYNMRVTGVKSNTNYIFSCWVAWNNSFNGNKNIVSFETVDISGDNTTVLANEGLILQDKTDGMGSWLVDDKEDNSGIWYQERPSRIISEKNMGGLTWYKLFAKVGTNGNFILGSININLGTTKEDTSTRLRGRRYFTDLRLEPIDNFHTALQIYINNMKSGIY